MFFILRTAFWLSLVIMLIPADASTGDQDQTNLSTLQALGAAQQTYVDMTRFCERNGSACDAGGAALEIFGAKARTGARMIYQYLDPEGREPDAAGTGTVTASAAATDTATDTATGNATGSITARTGKTPRVSQYPAKAMTDEAARAPLDTGTLTARDRAPVWAPPLPQDKPA